MENMKKIFTLALLISVITGFAQIPTGYYNTATGTSYTLKTQLYNIIKGHNDNGYDGLYVTYQTSDRDYYYENDGTILDMYSERPTSGDPYNYSAGPGQRCGNYSSEGDCYNREHLIPQSVFNEASPMKNDAHFVVPSDGKVNGYRSNYPFGLVGNASYTSKNGSKLGQATNSGYAAGYSGIVFEPIDEFKGDIARMYFYFATRYQNVVSGYSYAMFNGTNAQVFTNTSMEILKHWHEMDPVNQREIARNNAVYARQGNRNPFIDHPEYVTMIWGTTLAAPSFDINASVSVYPNPALNHQINISSETELDEIDIININGQFVQQIKKPLSQNNTYTVENMPNGFYFVKLTSNNQSVVKKVIVN
jgi:endonuclease I